MEAVGLMNEIEIGCLIVVRRGKAFRIVTERDLLKRVLAESREDQETSRGGEREAPWLGDVDRPRPLSTFTADN